MEPFPRLLYVCRSILSTQNNCSYAFYFDNILRQFFLIFYRMFTVVEYHGRTRRSHSARECAANKKKTANP